MVLDKVQQLKLFCAFWAYRNSFHDIRTDINCDANLL